MVVKGPSSGGKSYTAETVLKTLPQDAYLDFTSMSDHALIYDDRPVVHKVIVLYEASGLGADRQGEPSLLACLVRSLLSEGRIKHTTVEKTSEGMRPRHLERQGPTGMITTTTWASLHPENETRMLSVTVRDDASHTADILAILGDRAAGLHGVPPDLTPWHALQTWLETAGCRQVVIPFAPILARLCDARAVRLRRDMNKVFTLVRTHAMLHQQTRERDDQGRIVATLADYAAAHSLVLYGLDSVGNRTPLAQALDLALHVDTVAPLVSMTRSEDRARVGVSTPVAEGTIREGGLVTQILATVETPTGRSYVEHVSMPTPESWAYQLTPYHSGVYTLRIRATDRAGNSHTIAAFQVLAHMELDRNVYLPLMW